MKKAYLILSELDNEDLNWITKNGHKKNLEPGTTLIYEGQSISALYMVLDGTLRVYIKPGEAGQERELAQISAGEMVGEISFIDASVPIATVEALGDCTILEIPRIQLLNKLRTDQAFAVRFYRGICQCLADRMRGTVKRLGYQSDDSYLETVTPEFSPLKQEDLELIEAKFHWLTLNVEN
ncbi:putative transcriptional regulator, Crp/Fnr family [Thalassoporum mexicanum PCC 7367]|uniref:cyclic nucleotide-binding domain-containing protein n=1 Tax=Thalassoporum mexicanum TaxID=3457544 RepID=UPI00029FDD9A|nr:cyclic nucleotide-binding domain-containing protein [Pseudanabaena sp. PCC 7367]AFY70281.1 putative transcriptional regulator, Crp/Fnr family [Pseudanabaena sp. PCC 7367]